MSEEHRPPVRAPRIATANLSAALEGRHLTAAIDHVRRVMVQAEPAGVDHSHLVPIT